MTSHALWSLAQVAPHLNARLVGNPEVVPSALSLDTRTLQPGNCFVALRAERDGHDFAAQAVSRGAAALVVDHELDLPVAQLVVEDTTRALQTWGQARLAACRPPVVFGVTGSVGKTSTKELLAAATGAWKTPGNRNNTLGMPEALASLPSSTSAVVLEMGMSFPGEIRRLTEIAPLDFSVITNVGSAHIENFVEGQQGIAQAKGEIVAGTRVGGTWVHLASDDWARWITLQPWARHARAVAVGEGGAWGWSEARSLGPLGERFTLLTPEGPLDILLKLRGAHQVRNAALAGAMALLAGFDADQVAEGLGGVQPEEGRGRLHELPGGGWLMDESYNASQASILACGASLLELPGGEPVAVLGCMRELGAESEGLHRETGEGLARLGLRRLWAYGDQATVLAAGFGPGARAYPDFEALRDDSGGLGAVPAGARILVKGSRYWRSERAVSWLLARLGAQVNETTILG
ncbi:UDP-N-acetylmuramoyl-tripeptide--D-alanyl-D-alanine ligase [Holophaga foetida]|uniref:UDP-N-acetylmuramoyl-tripeptide--D-alanyl-D- alanine ligase n=1 Tax=Holophaga foetida TaxID=35839 RepID=UPI0002474A22|nr:UDP-N-acetylmuramoyl-tripeptide--D-alanyl-D-alanine ligase [Holophaga foetida]